MTKRNIAVIGSGISGLTSALLLSRKHNVTLFERNDYLGGHTNTIVVKTLSGSLAVDTGFIVFNDWKYPNFIKLLSLLGVDSQESTMSFSVQDKSKGLEYNGTSLNSLFSQRSNLFSPSFYRMLIDILRFNKRALELLKDEYTTISLGEYLEKNNYSKTFINHYIVPMGAAIWSTDSKSMLSFPAVFFVRFFHNHGMLSVNNRPQWRVIKGGSSQYVKAWYRHFNGAIKLNTPVNSIKRIEGAVVLELEGGDTERFNEVVVAVHSDQALNLLTDPSDKERSILSSIQYQENIAILHTDTSILPHHKRTWASWNYHVQQELSKPVAVTYNMNILQNLEDSPVYCVSLNCSDRIDSNKTIRTIKYHHPLYTHEGVVAQKQKKQISGVRNTHYCGAYWGDGFHEDGVNSALDVVKYFGESL